MADAIRRGSFRDWKKSCGERNAGNNYWSRAKGISGAERGIGIPGISADWNANAIGWRSADRGGEDRSRGAQHVGICAIERWRVAGAGGIGIECCFATAGAAVSENE